MKTSGPKTTVSDGARVREGRLRYWRPLPERMGSSSKRSVRRAWSGSWGAARPARNPRRATVWKASLVSGRNGIFTGSAS